MRSETERRAVKGGRGEGEDESYVETTGREKEAAIKRVCSVIVSRCASFVDVVV